MPINSKKLFLVLSIAVLIGGGFYFRQELSDLYFGLSQKISDIQKVSLNLADEIEKKISAPPPLRSELESPLGDLTKAGVIKWTNVARSRNGLLPLKENAQLDQAALVKAQDILKGQYFEHISPSGVGPAQLAQGAGYEFLAVGENLALGGFENDEVLVDAWMKSPGHRANILGSAYQEIGVAVLKGVFEGDIVWVAVQEFGRPLSACPQPSQSLKAAIDSNAKRLDSLLTAIEVKKQEIEDTPRRDRDEYNQKVGEYNELIRQYNSLVEQTKEIISTYNSQVAQFNQCAGQ